MVARDARQIQVFAKDAPRALVGHVRKKADHTH